MKAKKLGTLLSPLLCAAFALGMAACGDNPSDSSSGGSHGNKGYYTYNTKDVEQYINWYISYKSDNKYANKSTFLGQYFEFV